MTYRLTLYRGSKVESSALIEASLEEAKELAIAAISTAQAQRAELTNSAGSIVFQRWGVL